MWTRNWDNLILALTTVTGSTSSTAPSDYDPPIRYRKNAGSYGTIAVQNVLASQQFAASVIFPKLNQAGGSSYRKYEVIFGSGTTAEGYDDYNVDTRIYPSMTVLSSVISEASTLDTNTGAVKGGKIKRTMQYTGTTPITISEFGVLIEVNGDSSSPDCMVYRKVLDAPITLEQYDRLEIEFAYPDIMPDVPYPTP